jgi:hypothetical protein
MRHYIDEFIEPKEARHWNPPFEDMVMEVRKLHADGKSVEDISRELEEKHYIFNDDEEHQWNMKVVDKIINNRPVKNRFTGYTFSE